VSPLQPMNPKERMVADYAETGVTVGHHPMAHCRRRLRDLQVFRAGDLKLVWHGVKAPIAGQMISRQRPGTAHGFIFVSLEDETSIANAIVDRDLYEAKPLAYHLCQVPLDRRHSPKHRQGNSHSGEAHRGAEHHRNAHGVP